MSREDEEQLDKDKKRQLETSLQEEELLKDYKDARVRLRQAKAGQAKAASKRKAARPQVRHLPPMDVLDHAKAKGFAPPNSFLLRSFSDEAWCGRVGARGQVSRGWRTAGRSNAALHAVLVILWQQYCEDEGLTEADCHMKGVFVLPAPSASSGSA